MNKIALSSSAGRAPIKVPFEKSLSIKRMPRLDRMMSAICRTRSRIQQVGGLRGRLNLVGGALASIAAVGAALAAGSAIAWRLARSKSQYRRKDVEKDPRGEEEKEHGYLVVSGRPIPMTTYGDSLAGGVSPFTQ